MIDSWQCRRVDSLRDAQQTTSHRRRSSWQQQRCDVIRQTGALLAAAGTAQITSDATNVAF